MHTATITSDLSRMSMLRADRPFAVAVPTCSRRTAATVQHVRRPETVPVTGHRQSLRQQGLITAAASTSVVGGRVDGQTPDVVTLPPLSEVSS